MCMKTYIKHSGGAYFNMWIMCALFLGYDLPLCSFEMWTQFGEYTRYFAAQFKGIISMSQHPCGQLLFHLQMGRLRLREIKKPAPGHMVGEQLSINSTRVRFLGLCSQLLLGLCPKVRGQFLRTWRGGDSTTFPGDGPRCDSYSLYHGESLPGGQPQAFLLPWYLVKNVCFKVGYLLIYWCTICHQSCFLLRAFIHCSVRFLISSCWCFMLLISWPLMPWKHSPGLSLP